MTGPVRDIAQAATARLEKTLGQALAADVDAVLEQDTETPRAHADPVSIASLIVAIASLAWSIYTELRRSPRELAGEVRTRWAQDRDVDQRSSTVIDVVAEETVKYSER